MSYKDIIDNIPKDTNIDEIKTKYKDLLDVITNIEHLDNTTILKVLLDFDKRLTAVATEKAGLEDIVNVEFTPFENGLTYSDGVADYLGSLQITLPNDVILTKNCAVRINIKGSESIIVDVDESDNALEIHLDSNIISKIERSLVTPLSTPTETKLVGVDNTNAQTMLSLSVADFEIENNSIILGPAFKDLNRSFNNFAERTLNLSNPNILINGDFRINQRGSTTYTSSGYTVDRWKLENSNGSLTKNSNTITLTANTGQVFLSQRIENSVSIRQKTVTLSIGLADGTTYSATDTLEPTTAGYCNINIADGVLAYVYYYGSTGYFAPTISCTTGNSVEVAWIKLEFGELATPYHQRTYAEESILCERYYQKMSFTGSTQIAGGLSNGGTCYVPFRPSCDMRVRPTVTITGSYNFYNGLSGGSVAPTGFSVGGISSVIYIAVTHGATNTGASVTGGTYLSLRMLNGSTLELDAEI